MLEFFFKMLFDFYVIISNLLDRIKVLSMKLMFLYMYIYMYKEIRNYDNLLI